jgi:hypothetical protein
VDISAKVHGEDSMEQYFPLKSSEDWRRTAISAIAWLDLGTAVLYDASLTEQRNSARKIYGLTYSNSSDIRLVRVS